MNWAVDIPNLNSDMWDNVAYADTREEAIQIARERFGADENGCVCLVSDVGAEEMIAPCSESVDLAAVEALERYAAQREPDGQRMEGGQIVPTDR